MAFEEGFIQAAFTDKLGATGTAFLAEANKDDSRDKAALAQFEALADLRSAEANQLFDTIAASLRDHMKKEEELWWPALHDKMSRAELVALHANYTRLVNILPSA
jgi:hypothetical protein